MNKINFYFEIGMTVAVFVSSFLILTIEKDWWGGYLTGSEMYFGRRGVSL